MEKGLHLPPHRGDRRCIDSLAQQVEHIPFKDGVLGSSPRRITGVQMNKKAKAFHSWTDPQWKAFFRVFSFMSSFSCIKARKGSEKKIKASAEAGEVWPGTRQTWLASLTPLDARKGSEKKIKASAEAGEVWPGTRQTWLVSLTPPRGLVVPLAILEELTEELGLGLLVFGELLDGEDLLETLDVFLL